MITFNFLRSLQHFKIHSAPRYQLLPVDLSCSRLLPSYQEKKLFFCLVIIETRSYGIFLKCHADLANFQQKCLHILWKFDQDFLFSQTILANLDFRFGLFLFPFGFLRIFWTSLNDRIFEFFRWFFWISGEVYEDSPLERVKLPLWLLILILN